MKLFLNLLDGEWRLPFKRASKWAKINFGKHLLQKTLTQTEKMLRQGLGEARCSPLRPTEAWTPSRPWSPATHSQTTRALLKSPVPNENKFAIMEGLINKLTFSLESINSVIPAMKEQRTELMTHEKNTQTVTTELMTSERTTQTLTSE